MSFRNILTFIFSTTILISIVTINFLPTHLVSVILTTVCCVTLLQLIIQKSTPPIWQILYVFSIIFFLCLKEIVSTINLFDINNSSFLDSVGYNYSSEAYNKALIYIVYFVSGTYFAIIFLQEKVTSIPILPKKNISNVVII